MYLELIPGALQPVAGAHAFIDRLRAAGLRTALATGSDRRKLEWSLAAIGLPGTAFDATVSAEDVIRKKPDPETFLVAVARLGLPASRCLVVEDARNGVLAARGAGCDALGITSSLAADVLLGAGAIATAPDFTAVPAAIREALGLG